MICPCAWLRKKPWFASASRDCGAQIAAKGIVFTDYFVYDELKNEKDNVKAFWLGVVKNLKPGVTELYIHAGLPNDELKAITGTWSTRSQEFEVFTHDEEMKRLVADEKIILMGYRPLRELQRSRPFERGRERDAFAGFLRFARGGDDLQHVQRLLRRDEQLAAR